MKVEAPQSRFFSRSSCQFLPVGKKLKVPTLLRFATTPLIAIIPGHCGQESHDPYGRSSSAILNLVLRSFLAEPHLMLSLLIPLVCFLVSLIRQQILQGKPQGLGNIPQIQDRHVPLASLHRADEGAVQAASLAKLGLGQVLPFSPGANPVANGLQKLLLVKVHDA